MLGQTVEARAVLIAVGILLLVFAIIATVSFLKITAMRGLSATVFTVSAGLGGLLLIAGLITGESTGKGEHANLTSSLRTRPVTSESLRTLSAPSLSITSLQNEQPVPPMVPAVRGTSNSLDQGQEIWIVIAPRGVGILYPQRGPASVQPGGDWTSQDVYFNGDAGRKFDVVAVLADRGAANSFREYWNRSTTTGSSPGIQSFPKGTVEYDRVTVRRS